MLHESIPSLLRSPTENVVVKFPLRFLAPFKEILCKFKSCLLTIKYSLYVCSPSTGEHVKVMIPFSGEQEYCILLDCGKTFKC